MTSKQPLGFREIFNWVSIQVIRDINSFILTLLSNRLKKKARFLLGQSHAKKKTIVTWSLTFSRVSTGVHMLGSSSYYTAVLSSFVLMAHCYYFSLIYLLSYPVTAFCGIRRHRAGANSRPSLHGHRRLRRIRARLFAITGRLTWFDVDNFQHSLLELCKIFAVNKRWTSFTTMIKADQFRL